MDSFCWWAIGVVCGVTPFFVVTLLIQRQEKKHREIRFDYRTSPPREYKDNSLCQEGKT